MRLDYHSAKKYVQLECADTGKGLQFHEAGTIQSPYTDGRTIHVEEPNGMWDEDQWLDWEYTVYHEIGHESPENCDPHWKEIITEHKISTNSRFGHLLNLVSDHVQEHNRIGRFPGRDRVLKEGRLRFVNGKFFGGMHRISEPSKTPGGAIMKVCSVYDTLKRSKWNTHLAGVGDMIAGDLPSQEREMYDKLVDADVLLEEGKNERDSYELAKELLRVLGEDPEEWEQEAKDKKKEEAETGEGSKPASGEAGEGEGAAGKEEASDGELDEMEGYTFHHHYEKATAEDSTYNPDGKDSHIEYEHSEYSAGGFTPNDFEELDLKRGKLAGRRESRHLSARGKEKIENVSGGKVLAAQVKKLFISMKQLRWEHGHKRGHISSKNLWKARGPVYQSDVFKRRSQTLELNTAVTVLTDNSGSMGGQKFAHAARAGIMLNEAMTKVGIPVELLSFSEDSHGPVNIIVKGYNERLLDEDELTTRYGMCENWLEQNSDGESIMWAYNRLIKRKEKRRVLIVLSDGSPAAYNGGYGEEVGYTTKVIEEIENNTPVEIYGIGIMDNNVKRFYKDHKVLQHENELENMLLGLVKEKIMG